MPALIISGLKAAAWIAAPALAYLTVKEGTNVDDNIAKAVKWGVIGGAIYVTGKAAKVI